MPERRIKGNRNFGGNSVNFVVRKHHRDKGYPWLCVYEVSGGRERFIASVDSVRSLRKLRDDLDDMLPEKRRTH